MELMPMHKPAHPGEIIREYLGDTGIGDGAEKLDFSRQQLSKVLNGREAVTPELAISLEKAFPGTDAEFWLRLQNAYDLAEARKHFKRKVRVISKAQRAD